MGRANSLVLMTSKPALPFETGVGGGWGGGISPSPIPPHNRQEAGPAHLLPHHQGQLYSAAQVKSFSDRACFPALMLPLIGIGCCCWKEWGQLSVVLKHQHGFRHQPRHRTSAWPLVLTQASDINTDPGCKRTPDPDMATHGSISLDVIMASGGSSGHLDQHILPWQHSPQTPIWSLVTQCVS